MKVILGVVLLMLIGCGDSAPVVQTTANGCTIKGYGEGVFFFECSGDFGPALSEFRKSHGVLSVTSYVSYASAQFKMGTTGYWVITIQSPENTQEPNPGSQGVQK